MQVKPFGKLRKSNADGAKPRLKDLISYDMKQMHAAFTGTVPIGHQGMALIGTDVSVTQAAMMFCVMYCCAVPPGSLGSSGMSKDSAVCLQSASPKILCCAGPLYAHLASICGVLYMLPCQSLLPRQSAAPEHGLQP